MRTESIYTYDKLFYELYSLRIERQAILFKYTHSRINDSEYTRLLTELDYKEKFIILKLAEMVGVSRFKPN